MASDQQVALTRAHRGASNNINKTTRQVVPAFLQKLYEMVNDPTNADLIRWSDAGDSFFVLDHERFAREVLGRWFKHQNFSSFVRQLNMYGFHKIPHLQQGVLRSETDTEFWNFEHASFHRGQPDLLCLIQRKKQVTQGGEDGPTAAVDIRDPANPSAPNPTSASLSAGQILDIHSIVNGIAAIKRHQTTISAELNELKRSNQLLWQDSMAARARHQKHQDTINRILKFLAGVFGHNGSPVHKEDEVDHAPSRAVVPRKTQRLMIEDGPSKTGRAKGGVNVNEVRNEVDEVDKSVYGREQSPLSSNQYPTIETPGSMGSPYVPPSEAVSPSATEGSTYFPSAPSISHVDFAPTPSEESSRSSPHPNPTSASNPPQSHPTPTNPPDQAPYPTHDAPPSDQPQQPTTASPSALTSISATAQNQDQDALMQAAFNQILQSPSQMQRLFAALTSQTIPDPLLPQTDQDHSNSHPDSNSNSHSQLTPYEPQFDFSRMFSPPGPSPTPPTSLDQQQQQQPTFSPQSILSSASPKPLPPTAESLIPFDPPLAENTQRFEKSWKAAEDIDKDVNALHSSITSLIETFGLDPNLMGPNSTPPPDAGGGDAVPTAAAPPSDPPTIPSVLDEPPNPDMSMPDFDFDAFLNEYSHNNTDYTDIASTAFLDEVPSPSDGTASPIAHLQQQQAPSSPEDSLRTRGRKRKSNVADLDMDLGLDMNMDMDDSQHQQQQQQKRFNTNGIKPKRKK